MPCHWLFQKCLLKMVPAALCGVEMHQRKVRIAIAGCLGSLLGEAKLGERMQCGGSGWVGQGHGALGVVCYPEKSRRELQGSRSRKSTLKEGMVTSEGIHTWC